MTEQATLSPPAETAAPLEATINRKELLWMLDAAAGVIKARAAKAGKPALACVLLSAQAGGVEIRGSDLEISCRIFSANCIVAAPGEICLPAEKFYEIVNREPGETVTITVIADRATVAGADSKLRMYTQPASEYPAAPKIEGGATCRIPAKDLRRMLAQTIGFIDEDVKRTGAMRGAYFDLRDKALHVAVTEGTILAVAMNPVGAEATAAATVPKKALDLLRKMIADTAEEVAIRIEDNRAIFWTDSYTLVTNLLEGQFPDYRSIIPESLDKILTAESGKLISALSRAQLMTSETSKAVVLEMATIMGCRLTAVSPEAGDADIQVAAKYEGEDLRIGVKPEMLIDGIKAADMPEVKIQFSAFNRPIKLEVPGFCLMVMPINIV